VHLIEVVSSIFISFNSQMLPQFTAILLLTDSHCEKLVRVAQTPGFRLGIKS